MTYSDEIDILSVLDHSVGADMEFSFPNDSEVSFYSELDTWSDFSEGKEVVDEEEETNLIYYLIRFKLYVTCVL